jgi:hypothetical protein
LAVKITDQQNSQLLWGPKARYYTHNSHPLDHILVPSDPVQMYISLSVNFNIILPFLSSYLQWSFLSGFQNKTTCHVHLILLNLNAPIFRKKIQIFNPVTIHFSSRYILSSTYKFSSTFQVSHAFKYQKTKEKTHILHSHNVHDATLFKEVVAVLCRQRLILILSFNPCDILLHVFINPGTQVRTHISLLT